MKIQVLSENQIEKINLLTEEMIEKTGFRVENIGLLKIAAEASAIVDENNQTVRIPAKLLRELLLKVPKSYIAKESTKRNWIRFCGKLLQLNWQYHTICQLLQSAEEQCHIAMICRVELKVCFSC
jgi:trimethylamine:corrinoid methyltransferase-like protein